jgi:hypothetical protein
MMIAKNPLIQPLRTLLEKSLIDEAKTGIYECPAGKYKSIFRGEQ